MIIVEKDKWYLHCNLSLAYYVSQVRDEIVDVFVYRVVEGKLPEDVGFSHFYLGDFRDMVMDVSGYEVCYGIGGKQ